MKYNIRDIAMTMDYNTSTDQWEPGDIMLSAPAVDRDGRLLEESVDVHTRFGYENLRQILSVRFLTRQGDYVLRPGMGQQLDRIMGRRISRELIAEGKQYIIKTITFDNLVSPGDVSVTGLPFDKKTIIYTIAINCGTQQFYRFNLIYSAESGTWRIE